MLGRLFRGKFRFDFHLAMANKRSVYIQSTLHTYHTISHTRDLSPNPGCHTWDSAPSNPRYDT